MRSTKALIGFVLVTLIVAAPVFGQDTTKARPVPLQHAPHFVDQNGDGYDDNAPDHDGDGIPNGVDPDYLGPRRGRWNFVDQNRDGYNDNAPDHDGDGIPNGVDPDFTGARGAGWGPGFVDRDGDGINDNRAWGPGRGYGRGRGPCGGGGPRGRAGGPGRWN